MEKKGVFYGLYTAAGGVELKTGEQKTWLQVLKRFIKPLVVFTAAGFVGIQTTYGYEGAAIAASVLLAVDKFAQEKGWY